MKKPEPVEKPEEKSQDRLRVIQRPKKEADLDKLKDVKIPNRRVRMLMVNPTDFIFLLTEGLRFDKRTQIIKGVPEDAKVIAVAPDSMRNGIMLVVESKEYDEIPINVLPPVQPVQIDIGVPGATKKKKGPRKKR